MDAPTRILAVFSNAKEAANLRLMNEQRLVTQIIRESRYRDSLYLRPLPAATIEDLQTILLEDSFRIIHFSGHATEKGLVFEDDLGHARLIPPHAFAKYLGRFCPPLECVVLNACSTSFQAQLLHDRRLNYVIAMRQKISNRSALMFIRGFYNALGAGKTVPGAYLAGCDAIALSDAAGADTPVLLRHDGGDEAGDSVSLAHSLISIPPPQPPFVPNPPVPTHHSSHPMHHMQPHGPWPHSPPQVQTAHGHGPPLYHEFMPTSRLPPGSPLHSHAKPPLPSSPLAQVHQELHAMFAQQARLPLPLPHNHTHAHGHHRPTMQAHGLSQSGTAPGSTGEPKMEAKHSPSSSASSPLPHKSTGTLHAPHSLRPEMSHTPTPSHGHGSHKHTPHFTVPRPGTSGSPSPGAQSHSASGSPSHEHASLSTTALRPEANNESSPSHGHEHAPAPPTVTTPHSQPPQGAVPEGSPKEKAASEDAVQSFHLPPTLASISFPLVIHSPTGTSGSANPLTSKSHSSPAGSSSDDLASAIVPPSDSPPAASSSAEHLTSHSSSAGNSSEPPSLAMTSHWYHPTQPPPPPFDHPPTHPHNTSPHIRPSEPYPSLTSSAASLPPLPAVSSLSSGAGTSLGILTSGGGGGQNETEGQPPREPHKEVQQRPSARPRVNARDPGKPPRSPPRRPVSSHSHSQLPSPPPPSLSLLSNPESQTPPPPPPSPPPPVPRKSDTHASSHLPPPPVPPRKSDTPPPPPPLMPRKADTHSHSAHTSSPPLSLSVSLDDEPQSESYDSNTSQGEGEDRPACPLPPPERERPAEPHMQHGGGGEESMDLPIIESDANEAVPPQAKVLPSPYCPLHPSQLLRFLCEPCNQLICSTCLRTGPHKYHAYETLFGPDPHLHTLRNTHTHTRTRHRERGQQPKRRSRRPSPPVERHRGKGMGISDSIDEEKELDSDVEIEVTDWSLCDSSPDWVKAKRKGTKSHKDEDRSSVKTAIYHLNVDTDTDDDTDTHHIHHRSYSFSSCSSSLSESDLSPARCKARRPSTHTHNMHTHTHKPHKQKHKRHSKRAGESRDDEHTVPGELERVAWDLSRSMRALHLQHHHAAVAAQALQSTAQSLYQSAHTIERDIRREAERMQSVIQRRADALILEARRLVNVQVRDMAPQCLHLLDLQEKLHSAYAFFDGALTQAAASFDAQGKAQQQQREEQQRQEQEAKGERLRPVMRPASIMELRRTQSSSAISPRPRRRDRLDSPLAQDHPIHAASAPPFDTGHMHPHLPLPCPCPCPAAPYDGDRESDLEREREEEDNEREIQLLLDLVRVRVGLRQSLKEFQRRSVPRLSRIASTPQLSVSFSPRLSDFAARMTHPAASRNGAQQHSAGEVPSRFRYSPHVAQPQLPIPPPPSTPPPPFSTSTSTSSAMQQSPSPHLSSSSPPPHPHIHPHALTRHTRSHTAHSLVSPPRAPPPQQGNLSHTAPSSPNNKQPRGKIAPPPPPPPDFTLDDVLARFGRVELARRCQRRTQGYPFPFGERRARTLMQEEMGQEPSGGMDLPHRLPSRVARSNSLVSLFRRSPSYYPSDSSPPLSSSSSSSPQLHPCGTPPPPHTPTPTHTNPPTPAQPTPAPPQPSLESTLSRFGFCVPPIRPAPIAAPLARPPSVLYAFGRNNCGQLGLGHTEDALTAQRVHSAFLGSGASQHGLDLERIGSLFGLDMQELATDDPNAQTATAMAARALGIVEVAAGAFHTCLLDASGSLHAWGLNQYGQLGVGWTHSNHLSAPLHVIALPSILASRPASPRQGQGQGRAERESERKKPVDSPEPPAPRPVSERLRPLRVSKRRHSMPDALSPREEAAPPSKSPPSTRPLSLSLSRSPPRPSPSEALCDTHAPIAAKQGVVQLACGDGHTLILLEDGSVMGFGYNAHGELGLGHTLHQPTPVRIEPLSALRIVQLICGCVHSFALTDDGRVYAWGHNAQGQLGLGHRRMQLRPACVDRLRGRRIVHLVTGCTHAVALDENGAVFAWGYNEQGQLGTAGRMGETSPVPLAALSGVRIVDLQCGYNHTIAVSDDGRIFAWGMNQSGQLGIGNKGDQLSPTRIDGIAPLRDKTVVQVACGFNHTMMLTDTGRLYGFGKNSNGQLGLGHTNDIRTPHLVDSLLRRRIVQVVAGGHHSLVLGYEDGVS